MQARKTVQGKIVGKKIVCCTDEQIKLVQKLVKENCSSVRGFKEDVKTELEDVSVILAAELKICICKLCLSLVKKRKGLREKLLELDANIRRIHKANFSSSNPRSAVAKGLEYEAKVNTNNV